eukprot:scaffold101330_cov67-Phaeocystis_antarctica.AAC.3
MRVQARRVAIIPHPDRDRSVCRLFSASLTTRNALVPSAEPVPSLRAAARQNDGRLTQCCDCNHLGRQPAARLRHPALVPGRAPPVPADPTLAGRPPVSAAK